MDIQILETERTVLRGFHEGEAEHLHQILSEPGVLNYFPSSNPPSLERVVKIINSQRLHWEKHGYGWWALAAQEDNHLIGWCGLGYLDESDETEVKYLLRRSAWGRGIATEAASRSIEYGYMQTDLDTIIGLTHLENIASQRVLEKIGLTFQNQALYFGMECRRYTISRSEYESL